MKNFGKLCLLLSSIFTSFLISFVVAKEEKTQSKDDFYLIFVNNTIGETSTSDGQNIKRQEQDISNPFVDSLVDEIHNVIVENINTYDNPDKLEELNNKIPHLKKRDNQLINHGKSNFVYPVINVNNKTILYAYLSPKVKKIVNTITGISSCHRSRKFNKYYNLNAIKKQSRWKNPAVNENSPIHLSLISQGKFDNTLVNQYDTNYYYPDTAGEGVNMIFMDDGFNFRHSDFSNTSDRTVKCTVNINAGFLENYSTSNFCYPSNLDYDDPDEYDHGTQTATVASGMKFGVASKANVYAVTFSEARDINILKSLEYINNKLVKNNSKVVVNFPYGIYFPIQDQDEDEQDFIDSMDDLFSAMRDKGAIIVSPAGNESTDVYNKADDELLYPCVSDHVICVGGIQNYDGKPENMDIMNANNYKLEKDSNYGSKVDIYAPCYIGIKYQNYNKKNTSIFTGGTSYSSAVVAGVAATIMSERSDLTFNKKSMLDYLRKTALKDILKLPSGSKNFFVNNGKLIVYSKNNKYNGCGINAGNQSCASDNCCAADGHCYKSSKEVCKTTMGCQVNFGTCNVITSISDGKCGIDFGSCRSGNCCSYYGYCGKSDDHCDIGCQSNYGTCK